MASGVIPLLNSSKLNIVFLKPVIRVEKFVAEKRSKLNIVFLKRGH